MRWSSISVTSLRASSTGWTFVLKARPNRPSKRPSIFCSMVRSTFTNRGFPGSESSSRGRRAAAAGRARNGVPGHSSGGPWPARRQEDRGDPGGGDERQRAACGSARSVAPSRSVPNAAPPQGPRRRHAPTAAAAAASAIVSRASADDADRPSQRAESAPSGLDAPASARPGASPPTTGSPRPASPATTAAASTPATVWAARRAGPPAGMTTSGRSAIAPTAASSGPARKSSAARGRGQKTTSQTSAATL